MRRENHLSHADTGGRNKALTLEKANDLAEKFSKLPENVLQLIQAECSQIEENLESLPLGESSTSELGDIKFTYQYQKDKLTNLLKELTESGKKFLRCRHSRFHNFYHQLTLISVVDRLSITQIHPHLLSC